MPCQRTMTDFVRFIGASLGRSLGTNVASAVLLAAGVNTQAIARNFLKTPPWWLVQWWSPYPVVCVAFLLLSLSFYRYNAAVKFKGVQANMLIRDAVDYIVNESTANIDHQPMVEGHEHSEARILLSEQIVQGVLHVWGRRDTRPGSIGHVYESYKEPIPRGYWSNACLDYLSVFSCTANRPQTYVSDENTSVPTYTDLHVNRKEVMMMWPPKSMWKSVLGRLRGVHRITYPKQWTETK
jgi:hypothetical protein